MGNGSPSAYLLWSILSVIFQAYLVLHLWAYDKFQCIKWSSGRQPGAFRRVMVYSYLATLPLLLVFGVAMTDLKYREGFVIIPGGEIMPRPYEFWSDNDRRWIVPIYFLLSVAWGLEIITHLEELCFWLFLLNQGPSKRNWFSSWEFRAWYLGSIVAILGLPLTPLIRRHDLETCLPWILVAGSCAGAVTTIAFTYVLVRFPLFIKHVKEEGADMDVVLRLTSFYHLNLIRMVFRIVFNLPFLVLGLDGVMGDHGINESPFWSDFLFMLGAIGCFLSSAITLHIFFPRSLTPTVGSAVVKDDATATPPDYDHHHNDPQTPISPVVLSRNVSVRHITPEMNPSFRFPEHSSRPSLHRRHATEPDASPEYESDPEHRQLSPSPIPPHSPSSKARTPEHPPTPRADYERPSSSEIEEAQLKAKLSRLSDNQELAVLPSWRDHLHDRVTPSPNEQSRIAMVSQQALRHSNEQSTASAVHPYIMTFTSPIDLLDKSEENAAHRSV